MCPVLPSAGLHVRPWTYSISRHPKTLLLPGITAAILAGFYALFGFRSRRVLCTDVTLDFAKIRSSPRCFFQCSGQKMKILREDTPRKHIPEISHRNPPRNMEKSQSKSQQQIALTYVERRNMIYSCIKKTSKIHIFF